MGKAWTLYAGFVFAFFVVTTTSPLLALVVGAWIWLAPSHTFNALSGESVFGIRDGGGRMEARLINVGFRTAMVPMPGEPRPKRLLLRMEVMDADVFASGRGEGRVRLDAWPLDDASGVQKAPIYTVVAAGRGATVEDDSTLVVDHGSRRSFFTLTDGTWLYDADSPVASFASEGERRRMVALSGAEDDMPPQAVATLSYATAEKVLKKVMLLATDPARARLLRSSISLTRPVVRIENVMQRIVDVPLPAGIVRIPVTGDDLDLAKAQVPAGLVLVEVRPWKPAG